MIERKKQPINTINLSETLNILNDEGYVLLRDFDFNIEKLEEFSNVFCNNFHVVATRQNSSVRGDKYTTEVTAKNYALLGHTEGSYRPNNNPPEICFFMCVSPPSEPGGETTLVDGEKFFRLLPEKIRKRFENTGITYEMYWEKARWQNEFLVNDIGSLKNFLDNAKGVKYSLHNEDLHLFYTTEAVRKNKRGNKVFANAMLAHIPEITHPGYQDKIVYTKASNRVFFGDGEIIPNSMINELIDIHDSIMYKHVWQAQDLLVIDNIRYLHGRAMIKNDCGRVLVSRFGRFVCNTEGVY